MAGLPAEQSDFRERLKARQEKLAARERRRAAAHVPWDPPAVEKPTPTHSDT